MLKNFFVIVIFLFFVKPCFASSTDSLVRFKELTFKNEIEKFAFEKIYFNKKTEDYLNLFLTPFNKESGYSSKIAAEKIEICITEVKKEIANKSDSKKIKFIFDFVHKRFFKVYNLKNSFSDIFEKGEYNCVSATALYSLIYGALGYSYQIKETPTHVYLIVNPLTDKFLIETTSPEKGYYQFNENYVQKYVQSLLDAKIITKAESDTSNITALFNKHYFTSENLNLLQLAGIQYSNYGIYHYEDKKYEEAGNEIKMAYFLVPGERTKFLLKSTIAYLLSINNYEDQKQIDNLLILCRFNNIKDPEITNQLIHSEFSRVIQAQLINKSNYDLFEKSFNKIENELKDSTLKKALSFDYHYELARLGYSMQQDENYEFKHLKAAYEINPNHAGLQSIILAYFQNTVSKLNGPKPVLDLMNKYSTAFNFFNSNKTYNSIKANCFLELAYRNYIVNDLAKGDLQLTDFEKLYGQQKSVEPNHEFIERAYAVAAAAYYKKGNAAKSRQLIKKGLIYCPDSFDLKQRLNQL